MRKKTYSITFSITFYRICSEAIRDTYHPPQRTLQGVRGLYEIVQYQMLHSLLFFYLSTSTMPRQRRFDKLFQAHNKICGH